MSEKKEKQNGTEIPLRYVLGILFLIFLIVIIWPKPLPPPEPPPEPPEVKGPYIHVPLHDAFTDDPIPNFSLVVYDAWGMGFLGRVQGTEGVALLDAEQYRPGQRVTFFFTANNYYPVSWGTTLPPDDVVDIGAVKPETRTVAPPPAYYANVTLPAYFLYRYSHNVTITVAQPNPTQYTIEVTLTNREPNTVFGTEYYACTGQYNDWWVGPLLIFRVPADNCFCKVNTTFQYMRPLADWLIIDSHLERSYFIYQLYPVENSSSISPSGYRYAWDFYSHQANITVTWYLYELVAFEDITALEVSLYPPSRYRWGTFTIAGGTDP